MLVHEVIERQADDCGRDATHDDLAPEAPSGAAALLALARAKGVELVEVQHADGENRTELNNDEEHVPELFGDVQFHELVDQDHVTGRGDGQPLGDALDQTKEGGFEQVDGVHGNHSGPFDLSTAGCRDWSHGCGWHSWHAEAGAQRHRTERHCRGGWRRDSAAEANRQPDAKRRRTGNYATDYDAPNERNAHRAPDATNPTEPDSADSSVEPSEAELHTIAVHRRIRPHVHEPLETSQHGYT